MDRIILVAILAGLAMIYRKQQQLKFKIMATKAELLAIASELRGSIANIGADITRILEQNADNIPDDVIAEFRTLADDAKALADRTPEAESPEGPVESPEGPTEPTE